jgi:GNAT superfamily N-acetyltransferase
VTTAPGGPTSPRLRPAAVSDSDFCYELHRAALGPYVQMVFGWDERMQRQLHDRWFEPTRVQIVVAKGVDVGVLVLDRQPSEFQLVRIEIHPDHQGRSLGRQVVEGVLDEARAHQAAVALEVFVVNERARAFYQRLGFRDLGRDHDRPWKIRMRLDPTPTRVSRAASQ